MSSNAAPRGPAPGATLEEIVCHIGHLLPAQGPISVFIHHNTLHAFEHLPFENAVEQASRLFGCEPYLSEDRYRQELQRGRIHEADLVAEVHADLGARGAERAVGELSRSELRRRILVHGISDQLGPALHWTLRETDALRCLREDLPADAREAAGLGLRDNIRRADESHYVRTLWDACQRACANTGPGKVPRPSPPVRHRDLLLRSFDVDIDDWVHPILIRVSSAFLDQGLADWPMPGRESGLYRCFVEIYQHRLARLCRPIGAELQGIVDAERKLSHDGWKSLEASLEQLGVQPSEWLPFLLAESFALRGFAGMMQQYEIRPDRVPTKPVPARLIDFLATRMLIVRAALAHAGPVVGFEGELSAFRAWLRRDLPEPMPPSIEERAWPLFHVAQLAGFSANDVAALPGRDVKRIEREILDFDGLARRRTFHRAYERHLRHRFFDALVHHHPGFSAQAPDYQAIFCIDEREESIRRHLEEVDAGAETYGAAGFFGVAMYYQGATDAHPRPLCPVAIHPQHFVAEREPAPPAGLRGHLSRLRDRGGALVDKNVHLGSRRARLGAALFAAVGVLWVVPLVLRVIFPWLHRALGRTVNRPQMRSASLILDYQEDDQPPEGERSGFTVEEMADIVFGQLEALGICDRFAPLVLVLGHGSTSLNNPHESAHDCGACGGGRGGPNARAFAQMANRRDVRERLATRGLRIPEVTWFIGGERNTASNEITFYDTDFVPARVRPVLDRATAAVEDARRREAHERCRRFPNAPPWLPPLAALWHVQARSADLAQPRPEYGHATNAFCVVGRRARTRGLFLDRRAFLVSYDPESDADGERLERLLAAVVPVVAGISLEYFFGYIDPTGYGSGTKLPHNVTALVGVMDGAQSDLRTGLPWQMLEIHEPVRLSLVVEADAAIVGRILGRNEALARLVRGRWIYLAALDPSSSRMVELDLESARAYAPESPRHFCHGDSRQHYAGRRGHLPFVAVEPTPETPA